VLLGHQLLAHAWPIARDRERLRQARERVDHSPLGACAMAGTPHPIDRDRTATLLGFGGVVENAMDAVAARDHEQEVAATCAICVGHLSRMAEELVLWSSSEFAFVRLAGSWTTGSSIMPQKRNPDGAELVRGKAARVQGDLTTLLAMTRALPLAYNRDLQEDRRPLFDSVTTTLDCTGAMTGMWRTLEVLGERYETALEGSFSLATELADLMVTRGVPFREAHGVVGRIVRWCEERGTDLGALTPEKAREFHPSLDGDLSTWLDVRASIERRTSRGGTAWAEVERQVALLRGA
jgi:argininosuccinate lyase